MSLKKKTSETVHPEQFTINISKKLRAPCQLCVIHALQSPLLQFDTFFHITNPKINGRASGCGTCGWFGPSYHGVVAVVGNKVGRAQHTLRRSPIG